MKTEKTQDKIGKKEKKWIFKKPSNFETSNGKGDQALLSIKVLPETVWRSSVAQKNRKMRQNKKLEIETMIIKNLKLIKQDTKIQPTYRFQAVLYWDPL